MSVQAFIVNRNNLPLGRHYHKDKREIFVITEGGGEVLLCKVDEEGNQVGEIIRSEVCVESVIIVDPLTTHVFNLRRGSKMVCYSSKPFNPKDTYLTDWLEI